MITCTRRIQFCSGHRVHNHESKCRNLHGHNYVAFFHARAPELDSLGRVIDFSVLKEKLGTWIDKNWDHGFLFWKEDAEAKSAMFVVPNQKIYEMPYNPTAENMAEYLLKEISPKELEGTGVEVYKVIIWETENCFATAELEDGKGN